MYNPQKQVSDTQNSQEEDSLLVNQRKFQVFCRVRPLQEAQSNQDIVISQNKPTITIYHRQKNTSKVFTFHKIFHQTMSQSSITENLSNQIYANCRFNGNGCLVLSYGVTNSGKTYTILGTPQEPGLLPTLIHKLSQKMPQQKIYISAMENYIDDFYSLKNKEKLYLKEKNYRFEFQANQPQQINSKNFLELINVYIKNRNQSGTHANVSSSRSHAIFKIYCGNYYIVIVDLAGSQRLDKANSDQHQTIAINLCLTTLNRCIHAYQSGDKVPYRDHKLTQMFMQFFSPNYKIIMIAHLNRSGQMFHENANVLEYAALSTRVKQLNTQKNKSILKSASKFKHIDKSLSKKMDSRDMQNKQSLLENYKYFIKGMTFQFQNNLDQHLEQQDRKDKQFLKQLKQGAYNSPTKVISNIELEKMKVESRIKFREILIENLAAQKRQRMVECGIITGSSLRKSYEVSLRKRLQEQILKIQNDLKQSQQLQKQVQQHLEDEIKQKPMIIQNVFNFDIQKQNNYYRQPQSSQLKHQTPIKTPIKLQDQSIFKRIMKSPAKYFKSTVKLNMQNFKKTLSQKADEMVKFFGFFDVKPKLINQSAIQQIKKQDPQSSRFQQLKPSNNHLVQHQNDKQQKNELISNATSQENAIIQIKKQEHELTQEKQFSSFQSMPNPQHNFINKQCNYPFGARQSSIQHHEETDHENQSLNVFISTNIICHKNEEAQSNVEPKTQNQTLRKSCRVTFNQYLHKIEQSNSLLLNGINGSEQKNEVNLSLNVEENIISHIKQTQTIIYIDQHPHVDDTPTFPKQINIQHSLPSVLAQQNYSKKKDQPHFLPICDKENKNQNNKHQIQIQFPQKDIKVLKDHSTQSTTFTHKSPIKYAYKTQKSMSITKQYSHNHCKSNISLTKSSQINDLVIKRSGIKTRNQLRNKVNKERQLKLKKKI